MYEQISRKQIKVKEQKFDLLSSSCNVLMEVFNNEKNLFF